MAATNLQEKMSFHRLARRNLISEQTDSAINFSRAHVKASHDEIVWARSERLKFLGDTGFVNIPKGQPSEREGQQLELPQVAPAQETRVKAVISEIRNQLAVVRCQLPHDMVEVEIPSALIPEASLHYGSPVWVSVDQTLGVSQIMVEERSTDDVKPLEATDEDREIDAWLAEGE